jgi:hypothetical protein
VLMQGLHALHGEGFDLHAAYFTLG